MNQKPYYMGRIAVLSLFLLYFTTAPAQTSLKNFKLPGTSNSLLWRISGNGLKKSSYLFGTMHLNDKRLFNFDDSVYLSIENCEGMAIELNPDEMMAFQITRKFDNLMKGEKLDKVLTSQDYEHYSRKLSKKFKKSADKITTSDIIQEKNKWMNDFLIKGEMPTVVDAYLYNIAKKQGKWVGGIEDITDQAGIIEDNVDKTDIEFILAGDQSNNEGKKMIEKMISLYSSQDLEGIYALTNLSGSEQKDLILTRRNIKMAQRMDSLSAIRTMFFAVGAAHLPGDSGVISLLIKKGFTVEPVFSKTKIKTSSYKPKETEIPWVTVKDSLGLYEARMPGIPTPIKLYGLIEMKFLIDIFNFSGYYTMAIPGSPSVKSKDSMLHNLAQQMFSTNKKLTPKTVYRNGLPGLEFTEVKDGTPIRLQLFSSNNIIYIAGMFAFKKEVLQSDNAGKFFNSLVIDKTPVRTSEDNYLFQDPVMGFSMSSPAELLLNEQMSNLGNEAWKISVFTGTDMQTGAYIMLFSRDVKAGYSISSDSTIYAEQYEKLRESYNDVKRTETISDGEKRVEFTGINKSRKEISIKAISTKRNNRNILLMVLGDSTIFQQPAIVNLFSSIRFTSYPAAKWNWHSNSAKGITAWLPGNFREVPESFQNRNQVMAFDTTTATTFFISVDTLYKYSWYNSDSAMWKSLIEENSEVKEMISAKDVTNGKIKGKEIFLKSLGADNIYSRIRILVSDSTFYRIIVSAGESFIRSTDVNKLFDSLKIHSESASHLMTNRKTKLILKDLQDTSLTIRQEAYYHLDNAAFDIKDLPELQNALFKDYYSAFNDSLYVSADINNKLSTCVSRFRDNATVKFITGKYPDLYKADAGLEMTALATLANIHTRDSYHSIPVLMNKYPLRHDFSYLFNNGMKDSLALTASIFPELIGLAADSASGLTIADLANTLLDSGSIRKQFIIENEQKFITLGQKMLPYLSVKDSARYRFYLHSYFRLLGQLGTSASLQMLDQYQGIDNKYAQAEVIRQLLKNKMPVNTKLINAHAADKEMRKAFYNDLKKADQLALFPKQYLTQPYFAEASIYEILADENEPDKFEFITTKETDYDGKNYVFYIYKITFGKGEESESYMGISGGYSKNKNSLEPAEDLSGVYYDNQFNPGSAAIMEQLKNYLEKLKNGSSDDND